MRLRMAGLGAVLAASALLVSGCTSTPAQSAASGSTGATAASSSGNSAASSAAGQPGTTGVSGSGTAAPAGSPAATGSGRGSSAAPGNTPPKYTSASPQPPVSTAGPTVQTGGGIKQTVPTVAVTSASPVPLTVSNSFGGKVEAKITKIAAVTGTSNMPGEVNGPAVQISITISNSSNAAIGLNSVIVAVYDASGAPASRISQAGVAPFSGVLASGSTAEGSYVFTVPLTARKGATVTVAYSTGAAVLRFTGDLPAA